MPKAGVFVLWSTYIPELMIVDNLSARHNPSRVNRGVYLSDLLKRYRLTVTIAQKRQRLFYILLRLASSFMDENPGQTDRKVLTQEHSEQVYIIYTR